MRLQKFSSRHKKSQPMYCAKCPDTYSMYCNSSLFSRTVQPINSSDTLFPIEYRGTVVQYPVLIYFSAYCQWNTGEYNAMVIIDTRTQEKEKNVIKYVKENRDCTVRGILYYNITN